jgi:hypothetical protein
MSNLNTTLYADGVEVKDGSVEAVRLLHEALRATEKQLDEARTVLAASPDEVDNVWRRQLDGTSNKLGKLTHHVSKFLRDYEQRGLESALADARHREEI